MGQRNRGGSKNGINGYSQVVPWSGTDVEYTSDGANRILFLSRPGGGLFGASRDSYESGTLLFVPPVWRNLFLSRIYTPAAAAACFGKETVVLLPIPPARSKFLSLRMRGTVTSWPFSATSAPVLVRMSSARSIPAESS